MVGPSSFVVVYQKGIAMNLPAAEPWRAEQIEVMLWDFSYAGGGREWPASVPAPPREISLPQGGVYHHFLDGKYEPQVREFISVDPSGAVLLNGAKWSMSLRRRVPEEDYLQKVREASYAAR
jgi:hypothetical protein